jgi:hypothetical protein
MKSKHPILLSWLVLVCSVFIFTSCGEEELGKGDVEFEITDAPIDNTSVDAVMVTIADVKIDGESISGFSKQTINLAAYQNGNTKMLATALQLDARTYSNLTLVLDLDHDVNGDMPGCYVRTLDNTKHKLRTTASGIMDLALNKSWSVQQNATTKIVIDFDLRKSIINSDGESLYRFVSDNNLRSAIRIIGKSNSGTIKGTYEESISSGADEVIVYAYQKGTFNMETETQPQGEDQLLFANAVSSTKVSSSLSGNSFTLALLEAGEYELYFAKYNDNGSGELEFDTLLESETTVNGSINSLVMLQANLTTNIAVSITGLL